MDTETPWQSFRIGFVRGLGNVLVLGLFYAGLYLLTPQPEEENPASQANNLISNF